MIAAEFDAGRSRGRIILRPNRSWTWRANIYLVASLMAVSGSVATLLAYKGLWLVVPFTVVEMGVLLACLHYCVRRTHLQEVLTFSPEHLVFERGVERPAVRHRFQRYFTRVFVEAAPHPWYRKRVTLRSRGTEVEIGSFLNGDEREDLVGALRDMIQRLEVSGAAPESRDRQ